MSEPTSIDQDQKKAQEAAHKPGLNDGGSGNSPDDRVKEGQRLAEEAGLPSAPPEPKSI